MKASQQGWIGRAVGLSVVAIVIALLMLVVLRTGDPVRWVRRILVPAEIIIDPPGYLTPTLLSAVSDGLTVVDYTISYVDPDTGTQPTFIRAIDPALDEASATTARLSEIEGEFWRAYSRNLASRSRAFAAIGEEMDIDELDPRGLERSSLARQSAYMASIEGCWDLGTCPPVSNTVKITVNIGRPEPIDRRIGR